MIRNLCESSSFWNIRVGNTIRVYHRPSPSESIDPLHKFQLKIHSKCHRWRLFFERLVGDLHCASFCPRSLEAIQVYYRYTLSMASLSNFQLLEGAWFASLYEASWFAVCFFVIDYRFIFRISVFSSHERGHGPWRRQCCTRCSREDRSRAAS
jgi:hypothetical protein